MDHHRWETILSLHITFVAEIDGVLVGFIDMDETGYVDHLYVHHKYQRRGIASALLKEIEATCSLSCFTTYASISAVPFFEKQGYRMIKENTVIKEGVSLNNYLMSKENTR